MSAEKVPLFQILSQVALRTGFEIRGLEKLDEVVSIHFSNLSLRAGLENLLWDADYALIDLPARSGSGRPALLLIFGSHARGRQEVARGGGGPGAKVGTQPPATMDSLEAAVQQLEQDPTATEQQKATAALQLSVAQRDYDALRKALSDADPTIQGNAFEALAQLDHGEALDALLAAIKGGQGTSRLQALQLLDQARWADETTVLSVLREALKEQDPTAQGFAIQALANRGGSEAIGLLRQAFSDSDPNARVMILQSVAQGEEGQSLLRQATSDSDASVRTMAQQLLKAAESSSK